MYAVMYATIITLLPQTTVPTIVKLTKFVGYIIITTLFSDSKKRDRQSVAQKRLAKTRPYQHMSPFRQAARHFNKLNHQLHVFGVRKCHMTDKITDAEMALKGFHVIRKDEVRRLQTGVAVYIYNCLEYSHRKDLESDAIECVWPQVKPLKQKSFF